MFHLGLGNTAVAITNKTRIRKTITVIVSWNMGSTELLMQRGAGRERRLQV